MPVTVPPEVDWLLDILVGQSWPQGDEDALRRCSQAWMDAMLAIGGLAGDSDITSQQVNANAEAISAQDFTNFWNSYVGNHPNLQSTGSNQPQPPGQGSTFPDLFKQSETLAAALVGQANEVEYTKLIIVITLVLTAIQIAWALASAVFTLGGSTAEIPFALMFGRQCVMAAVGRFIQMALMMIVPDLIAQGVLLTQHRGWDWSKTWSAGENALTAGVIASFLGAGVSKLPWMADGLAESAGGKLVQLATHFAEGGLVNDSTLLTTVGANYAIADLTGNKQAMQQYGQELTAGNLLQQFLQGGTLATLFYLPHLTAPHGTPMTFTADDGTKLQVLLGQDDLAAFNANGHQVPDGTALKVYDAAGHPAGTATFDGLSVRLDYRSGGTQTVDLSGHGYTVVGHDGTVTTYGFGDDGRPEVQSYAAPSDGSVHIEVSDGQGGTRDLAVPPGSMVRYDGDGVPYRADVVDGHTITTFQTGTPGEPLEISGMTVHSTMPVLSGVFGVEASTSYGPDGPGSQPLAHTDWLTGRTSYADGTGAAYQQAFADRYSPSGPAGPGGHAPTEVAGSIIPVQGDLVSRGAAPGADESDLLGDLLDRPKLPPLPTHEVVFDNDHFLIDERRDPAAPDGPLDIQRHQRLAAARQRFLAEHPAASPDAPGQGAIPGWLEGGEHGKVLLVITDWDRQKGGIPVFNQELAMAFAQQGHEVYVTVLDEHLQAGHEHPAAGITLVTRAADLPADVDLVIGHARFTGLQAQELRDNFYEGTPLVHVQHMVPEGLGEVKAGGVVYRASRVSDYDEVVITGEVNGVTVGRIVQRDFSADYGIARLDEQLVIDGKPVFAADGKPVTIGQQVFTELGKGVTNSEAEQTLEHKADIALGVGPAITRDVVRLVGGAASPLVREVIPGLDFSRVVTQPDLTEAGLPADGEYNILLIGRADEAQKGALEAARMVGQLSASPDLQAAGLSVRLTIRGFDGALADQIPAVEQQLSQVAGGAKVTVLPFSSDAAELDADLSQAHLVIAPGSGEGFGMSAAGAAAVGVPVLVPDSSGFGAFLADPQRVTVDTTGMLVHQGFSDQIPVDAWTAKISDVLGDLPAAREEAGELASQLRAQGRTWAGTVDSVLDAVRDLYRARNDLVSRGGDPPAGHEWPQPEVTRRSLDMIKGLPSEVADALRTSRGDGDGGYELQRERAEAAYRDEVADLERRFTRQSDLTKLAQRRSESATRYETVIREIADAHRAMDRQVLAAEQDRLSAELDQVKAQHEALMRQARGLDPGTPARQQADEQLAQAREDLGRATGTLRRVQSELAQLDGRYARQLARISDEVAEDLQLARHHDLDRLYVDVAAKIDQIRDTRIGLTEQVRIDAEFRAWHDELRQEKVTPLLDRFITRLAQARAAHDAGTPAYDSAVTAEYARFSDDITRQADPDGAGLGSVAQVVEGRLAELSGRRSGTARAELANLTEIGDWLRRTTSSPVPSSPVAAADPPTIEDVITDPAVSRAVDEVQQALAREARQDPRAAYEMLIPGTAQAVDTIRAQSLTPEIRARWLRTPDGGDIEYRQQYFGAPGNRIVGSLADRSTDAESLVVDQVSIRLGALRQASVEPQGVVVIGSDKLMCPSCQARMFDLIHEFPGVQVVLATGTETVIFDSQHAALRPVSVFAPDHPADVAIDTQAPWHPGGPAVTQRSIADILNPPAPAHPGVAGIAAQHEEGLTPVEPPPGLEPLAGLLYRSHAGLAGFDGSDPRMFAAAARVHSDGVSFVVDMHGEPGLVRAGSGEATVLPPEQLREVLRQAGWDGSQRIVLLACDTGRAAGQAESYAAALARVTGTEVVAPTGRVWQVASDDHVFIAAVRWDEATGQWLPDLSRPGQWLSHDPSGSTHEVTSDQYGMPVVERARQAVQSPGVGHDDWLTAGLSGNGSAHSPPADLVSRGDEAESLPTVTNVPCQVSESGGVVLTSAVAGTKPWVLEVGERSAQSWFGPRAEAGLEPAGDQVPDFFRFDDPAVRAELVRFPGTMDAVVVTDPAHTMQSVGQLGDALRPGGVLVLEDNRPAGQTIPLDSVLLAARNGQVPEGYQIVHDDPARIVISKLGGEVEGPASAQAGAARPAPDIRALIAAMRPPDGDPSVVPSPLELEQRWGITQHNQKLFQFIADKYGLAIDVRPTNPESVPLLEAGGVPKPPAIKMKTINALDVLLGAPEMIGAVGFFKPVRPAEDEVPAELWQAVQKRFDQREAEYTEYLPKMEHLVLERKFRVVDGVVYPFSPFAVHETAGRFDTLLVGDSLLTENGQAQAAPVFSEGPGGERLPPISTSPVLDPRLGPPVTGDHDMFDIRTADGQELPYDKPADIPGYPEPRIWFKKLVDEYYMAQDQVRGKGMDAGEMLALPMAVQHGAMRVFMRHEDIPQWELDHIFDPIIVSHLPGREPLIRFQAGRPPMLVNALTPVDLLLLTGPA